MYKQRKERQLLKKDPDLFYKDKPEYMKCRICLEWKLVDKDYYRHRNNNLVYKDCKKCRRKIENDKSQKIRDENGGGNDYKPNPNEYVNEAQKNAVFKIMLSLGWKFCEETKTWYKEGIKDKFGNFSNIKPYLDNRYKYKKKPEIIDKMRQMRKDKYTYREIAKHFNMGYNTVYEWMNK